MSSYPADLIAFTQAAINTFGAGRVRWTYLTVASMPGYQLGESPMQEAKRRGWFVIPPPHAPRSRSTAPKQERRSPTVRQGST